MNDRSYAKVKAPQKTLIGSSPSRRLLQRTCACGGSPGIDGLCTQCREKQLTLSRSQRAFEPPSAPGGVPGSTPAQEHGPLFNAAFDRASHFGHDFSQIPIHAPAAGVLQTKLAINKPGDHYEQEADRVSEQVMRMPDPQLQRTCHCGGACPKCQAEQQDHGHAGLQTKHVQASDMGQMAAPPIVHEVLRSPGQSLDPATRAFMESRFGHDFSRVRVHTGTKAAQSAAPINALAYTVGSEVVFGAHQYAPHTGEGGKLLAHELAHTIQQGEHIIVAPSGLALGQTDGAYDRAADAAVSSATRIAAPLPATLTMHPLLQRQPAKTRGATSVPIKGSMPAIFFQFDSTEMRHDAEDDSMIHFVHALVMIQEHLKKNPKLGRVILHGFASMDGQEAHNLALSQKRADRIQELLVEAGIPKERISAFGHGGDSTFPGLAWNRRVSIELQ